MVFCGKNMKNIYPDLFIFTKKHFKFTKKPKFQNANNPNGVE